MWGSYSEWLLNFSIWHPGQILQCPLIYLSLFILLFFDPRSAFWLNIAYFGLDGHKWVKKYLLFLPFLQFVNKWMLKGYVSLCYPLWQIHHKYKKCHLAYYFFQIFFYSVVYWFYNSLNLLIVRKKNTKKRFVDQHI